jgi:REP element-mobilizing transposase RayT
MIRDENHFFQTAEYIEENPVKAGLCNLPDEWEWGSAFARNQQRG